MHLCTGDFLLKVHCLMRMMLLMEDDANNVLVGAIDEITDTSHAILKRFGFIKMNPVSNLNLYETKTRGTIAGEGPAFFLLTNAASDEDYAELRGMYYIL